MAKQTLSERATEGLRRLVKDRGWGFQRRVAEAAGLPPSSMTRIMRGEQPVTLSILEAIQRVDGTNPLHLLAGPDDELKPVNGVEATLLRYLRLWPASVARSLCAFLEPFANEAPLERDLRNGMTLLRELTERQRQHVLAHMLMLREGLPRDLEVALRLPAANADTHEQATRGARADRRRRAT